MTAGLACQARRVRGPEEGCQASHWVRGGQSAPPQQLRGVVGAAGLPQLSLWSPPVLHSRAGWTGLPCISGGTQRTGPQAAAPPSAIPGCPPRTQRGDGTSPCLGPPRCPGPQQRGTGGRARWESCAEPGGPHCVTAGPPPDRVWGRLGGALHVTARTARLLGAPHLQAPRQSSLACSQDRGHGCSRHNPRVPSPLSCPKATP